ncbi:MAG: heme A synthase [marine bacterium B5-7]|nr:MAG: heme A synthase [marine bacterium B5-7]
MLFMSASTDPGALKSQQNVPMAVVIWLLVCCALVFAMVVIGGVTRLTGSGLSMVEWQPLMGIIPPLGEAEWHAAFVQYQSFPEFQYVNSDMDLAGFKFIFYFEYAHRLLGRVIGLVFLLPMLWFWWRNRLNRAVKPHLLFLFVLGALQGLLGWYMVKSGLVDNPRVSQYRLMAHLCMAVVIYGYMLFIALELMRADLPAFMRSTHTVSGLPGAMLLLVFVMIASGALVAGTHAGHIYSTYPDMHGQWIPDGIMALTPWWLNVLENPVTIQFDHRWLGIIVLVSAITVRVLITRRGFGPLKFTASALVLMVALQVVLGIATLLAQVPVFLGALHQAGALAVFTIALVLFQKSRHTGVHRIRD